MNVLTGAVEVVVLGCGVTGGAGGAVVEGVVTGAGLLGGAALDHTPQLELEATGGGGGGGTDEVTTGGAGTVEVVHCDQV